MDDQISPLATTPDSQTRKLSLRNEEAKHASQLGQKRFAQDKEIKEKLKAEQELQDRQQHESVREQSKILEAKKEATNDYRKEFKRRQKEVEADRLKRDAQRLEQEELKRQEKEKRKKEKEYLDELHKAAAVKYDRERAIYLRKLQREKDYNAANAKAHAAMYALEREHTTRREAIEHDAMMRWGMIDAEAKTKAYQLEAVRRMKLAEFDNDMRGRLQKIQTLHDWRDAQSQRNALETQEKTKRKILDSESEKRKIALDLETRLLHNAANAQKQAALTAADTDMRQKRKQVELTLRHELDEIARRKQ